MIVHGDSKLIMGALVKARSEIGATVGKDKKGNFGNYATLAAITEATTEALAKHGLAIVQEAELSSDGVTVGGVEITQGDHLLAGKRRAAARGLKVDLGDADSIKRAE